MVAVKKIVVFFAKGSVLAAAIVLITAATLKVQSSATFRDTLAAHQVLPPPTWDAMPPRGSSSRLNSRSAHGLYGP